MRTFKQLSFNDRLRIEVLLKDIAQQYKEEVLAAKGIDLKIGNDKAFADRIEEIIINDGYSPAAALAKMQEEGYKLSICVTTLYSYIDR